MDLGEFCGRTFSEIMLDDCQKDVLGRNGLLNGK